MAPPGFCDFDGCTELAIADEGGCYICEATLCPSHYMHEAAGHICPRKFRTDLTDASGNFQWDTLTEEEEEARVRHYGKSIRELEKDLINSEMTPAAASLRPGLAFTITGWRQALATGEDLNGIMGSFNMNLPVTYGDGVKWLARAHHYVLLNFQPNMFGNASHKVRAGELAAIQTARALAPQFIPDVHLASTQNVDTLSFIFMDRAAGQRCDLWVRDLKQDDERRKQTGKEEEGAKEAWGDTKRPQIVKDVANFMVKVSAREFSGVGSLNFDVDGNVVVGPLIAKQFIITEGAKLDVYATSAQCYLARLDHILDLIRTKKFAWGGARPHDHIDPVWQYVFLLEVCELVRGSADMNREQPTYLRHMDDHAGQFIVDKEGSINAIIDWEFTATVPFAQAFTAPEIFRTAELGGRIELHDTTSNDLTPLELQLQQELRALGRDDMAIAVTQTRQYQRLDEAMWGSLPGKPRPSSYENAVGLVRAFNPPAEIPSSKAEWVKAGKLKFADSEGLKVVVAEWEAYLKSKAAADACEAAAAVDEKEASVNAAASCASNATEPEPQANIASGTTEPTTSRGIVTPTEMINEDAAGEQAIEPAKPEPEPGQNVVEATSTLAAGEHAQGPRPRPKPKPEGAGGDAESEAITQEHNGAENATFEPKTAGK